MKNSQLSSDRSGRGDGLMKNTGQFRGKIAVPTICPKCETVYSHANEISECLFCNWRNKNYKQEVEDSYIP